jgi:hypothetical protein
MPPGLQKGAAPLDPLLELPLELAPLDPLLDPPSDPLLLPLPFAPSLEPHATMSPMPARTIAPALTSR